MKGLVFVSSLLAWTGSVAAAPAAAAAASTPQCTAVTFTVDGTAQNKNLTGIPLTGLGALVDFFEAAPVVTATGPQKLAGTYCKPTTSNKNGDKLQVFFGSILANGGSWQALGGVGRDDPPLNPDMYSWTQFANKQGYPTLVIDRLGTGKSSHPDPVLIVQAPYEIALYNNLAQQIRGGSTGQLPRSYNYLIYVGNSYGSQLGGGMANSHPDSYNEFILTGFTYNFQQDFLGVTLAMPAPAAVADPARFGTLDPGYLAATSEQGQINAFFGSHQQVNYDDNVADTFFKRRDVVSIGQFASIYGIVYNAPAYTGRIFVLDGEQDEAACGPGSPVIGPASCGQQPAMTGTLLFPASNFNYKTVDKTGHGIQLDLTSQKVFTIAHQFLAGQTFKGGAPA